VGPILLAAGLLLLAATGRPARAAPQAGPEPSGSAQVQSGPPADVRGEALAALVVSMIHANDS
jgi:hypothetical protein